MIDTSELNREILVAEIATSILATLLILFGYWVYKIYKREIPTGKPGPKSSAPSPPAPQPSSVKITELKPVEPGTEDHYVFMKQDQFEAMTKKWDSGAHKGVFEQTDSISFDDPLKRLEAKKKFWEERYFHFHKKMGKTLSMQDYFEYGKHADDARHNIRVYEDQIFYLKSAISTASRTVGNYESKIKS